MAKRKTAETQPIEVLSVRQMKILFNWRAPLRVFKEKNRDFWTTVLAIIFLLGLILFFVHEWLLIAAMVSLAFVYYVLSTVPPEEIEYRITTRGISFEETTYDWDLLSRFWFSDKGDHRLVNLETKLAIPGRVSLVIQREDEGKIKEILDKYLLNEKPRPSFIEKASDWLARKIPLEIENK